MALILCFILSTFLQTFSVVAQQRNGSIPVGASLTATDDVEPWLSPSGDFAFGFKKILGNDNFVLSIWYDKIPDQTVVWYPQRSPTVSRGSKVELISGLGLVLSDPQVREVWSSRSISDVAYGVMNDTGNFVIVDSNSINIWESFNNPADTMLPTQVLERGGIINSKLSQTNFSRGRFQLRLLQEGNLVLNSRDIAFDFAYVPYYESKTEDLSNSSNSGSQLIFDEAGYMYILKRNGQMIDFTIRNTALSPEEYYHRATLDSDGVLTLYTYPKNPTGNTTWQAIWFEKGNLFSYVGRHNDSRACGFNNVCNLETARPNCECPQGFSLLDPNDPNGDCKLDFTLSCDEGESNEDIDFIELANECRNSCKEDCFCVVAIFNADDCWKKQLPLINGRRGRTEVAKALVKFRKGEVPDLIPTKFPRGKKDQKTLITIISTLLGSSVFINVMLIGLVCLGFFMHYQKKDINHHLSSKFFNTNLPHFTYQELVEATNVFKEELGRGAFGIVYKGVIGRNIVAVKKLDRVFDDGEKEFQTESRTNTGIRGTKGYVAPEWFRNTAVTIKVDVYSFGVLLLEIISCRRSVKNNESGVEYGVILTDWAWDCYQDRILDAFVENDMEAIDDYKKLTTFVMVGLWCVQENPSQRPTMRKVIQMLEGVIEVSVPPCPFPFSVTSS
ncbi:hypothetical protein L1987_86546 [Smallanthus sonchifolius]|uniref:Uncharacterized protein n=1 Tax=Smallanthus sonchifolius TaxID=185202 RepID=A0ACB8Y086_9ASTR|nr:hypothetical protein L1987_86546 [Smallanthus sonchifolius]